MNTIAKYGTIDVLINNAGISMRALFEDVDLSVLRRLMDTNFWGTVYCTKFAFPYLLKSKGSSGRDLFNRRIQRITGKNRIFFFEICYSGPA